MNNKGFARKDRVADAIGRVINKLLQQDFKDPRVGLLSVVDVDVSPDLSNAKIYVTFIEVEKQAVFIKILNRASGFFRNGLAKALNLRVAPRPHFIFDDSMLKGRKIESLLDNL